MVTFLVSDNTRRLDFWWYFSASSMHALALFYLH